MFIKCKAFFYALYLIFITNKLGQYCHHQYMNEYTESWEIQTIRLSPPESGGTRIQNQAGCFQTRNSAPFFVYSLTPSHFSSFSSFFPSLFSFFLSQVVFTFSIIVATTGLGTISSYLAYNRVL